MPEFDSFSGGPGTGGCDSEADEGDEQKLKFRFHWELPSINAGSDKR
jgi:hypothetical protein